MKTKIAAALAVIAAPMLIAFSPADAAHGPSVNCHDNGDRIRCAVNDTNDIKRIRVVDANTGELIKQDFENCADQVERRVLSFPDTSNLYRIQVVDCAGQVHSFTYST